MGMGFILPFALTFVAIPLETFVYSVRTVAGMVGMSFMRGLALVLRLLANISLHLGALFKQLYDVPIFVPLWLEERMNRRASGDENLQRAS